MEENKIILYKDEEGKVTPLSRICNPTVPSISICNA